MNTMWWKQVRASLPHQRRDWMMVLGGIAITLLAFLLWHWLWSLQTAIPYQNKGVTAKWIPTTVKYWGQPINDIAKKYNIDPNFVAIIMTMESGGDPKAISDAGAQGLMQITPLTAGDIAKRYLKQPVKTYNLFDPKTNIEFGIAYLAELRNIYGDAMQGPDWNSSVELVSAAYNGGFSAANSLYKGNGLTDTQTVVYSRDAFNMWRERKAGDSPTFDRWKERGGSILLQNAQQNEK